MIELSPKKKKIYRCFSVDILEQQTSILSFLMNLVFHEFSQILEAKLDIHISVQ